MHVLKNYTVLAHASQRLPEDLRLPQKAQAATTESIQRPCCGLQGSNRTSGLVRAMAEQPLPYRVRCAVFLVTLPSALWCSGGQDASG